MKTLIFLMLLCLTVGTYCNKTEFLRLVNQFRQDYCNNNATAEQYLGTQCWNLLNSDSGSLNFTKSQLITLCNNCCNRLVDMLTDCGGESNNLTAQLFEDGCDAAALSPNYEHDIAGCSGPTGPAGGALFTGMAVPIVLLVAKLAYLLL